MILQTNARHTRNGRIAIFQSVSRLKNDTNEQESPMNAPTVSNKPGKVIRIAIDLICMETAAKPI